MTAASTGNPDGLGDQLRPSRRRFFEIVVGVLSLALTGRTASAAPEAAAQPPAELPPAGTVLQLSPGPDWERVPPSRPGGLGGWRNPKTGEFRTDWFQRSRNVLGFEAKDLSPDPQALQCACWEGKAKLWVIGPGGNRARLAGTMRGGGKSQGEDGINTRNR